MSRFWSDDVAKLSPYVAGEQPKVQGLLKLNTNESPYGPSPRAIEAILAAAGESLRRYPDNEATALREAAARAYGVRASQVFPGNGSDEVLAHIFNALFRHAGRALWLPDITYSFYRTYCSLFHIPAQLIPLGDDFSVRPQDYIGPHKEVPAGIIFANPNAPTGLVMPLSAIREIAQSNPGTAVVVDEAYVDFGADSAIVLLDECPNLVVVHTLSKSRSLAGLRVGYAIAGAEIIDGLNRVKDSFNSYPLDSLAQTGAIAALDDKAYFDQTRHAVMEARDELTQGLAGLGFEVLPSTANFVFARHPRHQAVDIAAGLRAEKVLVRHFRIPRIEQFLRITVGTPQECQRLCEILRNIVT